MKRTIWTFTLIMGLLTPAVPAQADSPLPVPMAFAKVGEILLSTGTETYFVTNDGAPAKSWPRLSPDGTEIAYVRGGNIWIAYVGSGRDFISTRQITFSGDAGGPSWSPHGDYLAYRAGDVHYGTLFQVRVSANSHPVALRTFRHTSKRVPLHNANTVAWSPNGRYIAFPGGECWAIYDDCLSILDLETNAERTVAAFGGGGSEQSGYATAPSWGRNSDKLFWTQQIEDGPIRSFGYHTVQKNRWQVGQNGDAIPVSVGHGRFLVTSMIDNQEWITYLEPDGTRIGAIGGSQHDWRPAAP